MGKTEPKNSFIGTRLRLAREQAGLSQGQIAKMLQMHRPSISELEAGRRKVSSEELIEFARIYDVSLSWLAGTQAEEENAVRDKIELAAREIKQAQKQKTLIVFLNCFPL